jgi:DNA-binding SARP family transcriptional activator
LLAALALNSNEVVSASLLADTTWGATPPRSTRQNLHTRIWSLRRALAAAGRLSIEARTPGYDLRAEAGDLDWLCFHRDAVLATKCAADDPVTASRLLHAALAYWPSGTWQGSVIPDVADAMPALRPPVCQLYQAMLRADPELDVLV